MGREPAQEDAAVRDSSDLEAGNGCHEASPNVSAIINASNSASDEHSSARQVAKVQNAQEHAAEQDVDQDRDQMGQATDGNSCVNTGGVTRSSTDIGVKDETAKVSGDCWNDFNKAGLFRRMTFIWATPLMNIAFRREIEASELWQVLNRHKGPILTDKLAAAWAREVEKRGVEKARLYRALIPVFGYEYFQAFMYQMAWLVAVTSTNAVLLVQLLNLLDDFARGEVETVQAGHLEIPYFGFVYAILFGVGEVFRSVFINQHWAIAGVTGVNVRSAAASLLFQKTTRLRNSGNAAGQLLNMMSNDVERLRDAATYGIFIIMTPITLLTIVGLGLWVLGPSILAGMVVLILSVPLQARIAKMTSQLRAQSVVITDQRVTLMNEILQAAQLIKLYAWESSFVDKVAKVRAAELVKIRQTTYVKAVNGAFSQIVPLVTSFASFLVHTVVLGETLTASQAFATLSLFNVSRFPLSVLPISVRFVAEASIALRRIGDYLKIEELIPEQATDRLPGSPSPQDPVIEIENGRFVWYASNNPAAMDEDSQPLCIDSVRIMPKTLTCIVGAVGHGKSSLFSSLLGDMRRIQGRSCMRGSVAYVGQNPWVFNATFKENILFGKPYDPRAFRRAIKVAALEPDLEALPSGIMTELGERGINVSGGQKARLALARAVYSNADVYLLDDVLSAVDAHVSAHIWKHCICSALKDKTVILVTHGLHLLPEADHVIVMENMVIAAQGTFEELQHGPFQQLVVSTAFDAHRKSGTGSELHESERFSLAPDEVDIEEVLSDLDETSSHGTIGSEEEVHEEEQGILKDKQGKPVESTIEDAEDTFGARRPTSEMHLPGDNNEVARGKLTTEEDRKVGAVSKETVKAFSQSAGGSCILIFCFAMFWLSEGSKNGSEAWLTAWSSNSFNMAPWFYNLIYGLLTLAVTIFMVVRGVIFGRAMLRASQGLHDAAFLACMQARMDFFQITPLGRILARFSSDIDKIDTLLVDVAEVCISLLVRTFLAIVVIAAALPAFLVAIVPLGFLYVRLLNYFRRVVRQMKRMDSMSRSPMISQVQSLVLGLTETRAFGRLEAAVELQYHLVEETSRGYLGFYMANRWIGFRLDYITTAIVTVSAFLCIIFASSISAGLAGLVLSSSLQTAGIMQFATRQAAELEAQFTSVERVRYFIESTPREEDTIEDSHSDCSEIKAPVEVSSSWPSKGEIQFVNYSARYREGLPCVLRNLTMTIPGGQSTALVGRSGSGKSTVSAVALFRIIEALEGQILIDGVNIAKIPLKVLRGRALAIVPQSPTLFAGTIRSNLDPFDEHTDDEIWEALRNVHLADFVASLGIENVKKAEVEKDASLVPAESFQLQIHKSGLSHVLSEGGSNLSAGQRQLLAFGRALLKNAQIICVDEGTSSVDEAADLAIQNTLKHACHGRTLIIVAHRLASTSHCDQVCVLEQGALLESGRPMELLQNPSSHYAALWEAAVSAANKGKEDRH
mmetsp:Transcript_31/g.111  ORF Transcript_31/g.111 Transcript_31/m.111 type:complete len:1480 (+) Transcript_31:320-4759(+)|eukprot:CAMPEP_0171488544 /NCGR_PEP_ID=MMETSP0958-20121227/2260_1 /TAXON_ID=87120 /ORGANISM="Aurantiochytrium limacinum, Strain ATCCMYA-1381" /LENGTH=1479 /DNA_ID=CAMNT_0012021657 /DNA_START=285 /DNA_END=4724 /DNA_ORIENTATION=-